MLASMQEMCNGRVRSALRRIALGTHARHAWTGRRVPWQQSQQFFDALQAHGVESRLVLVPDADHEFGGLSEQRRRQQVDTVIEWLGSHTKS